MSPSERLMFLYFNLGPAAITRSTEQKVSLAGREKCALFVSSADVCADGRRGLEKTRESLMTRALATLVLGSGDVRKARLHHALDLDPTSLKGVLYSNTHDYSSPLAHSRLTMPFINAHLD